MVKIGIIGGSGLDDPNILKEPTEKETYTDYGEPSSPLICGKIQGIDVVILARHGKDHSIMPTKVNYRANIAALKDEGCTHILATTAVGSLQKHIEPGTICFPDQFIDFTKQRNMTFFTEKVVHTQMADPFDATLRTKLIKAANETNIVHKTDVTIITIEGPRFSTKAESNLFRSWKADIINMSTCPEVILANELGIPYQAIAMTTDYDCWKVDEEPVTWEMILERMKENAEKVKELIINVLPQIK